MYFRSDMAKELRDRYMKEYSKDHAGEPDGIAYTEKKHGNMTVCTVRITNANGEKLLGRPVGTYVTLNTGKLWRSSAKEAENAAELLAGIMKRLGAGGRVLAAGLGNRRITADSVGPEAADRIVATHHIVNDRAFENSGLGDVAVLAPGVLSQTGIEAAEQIRSAASFAGADCVIVIDALAAHGADTLSGTVQITDTGIRPGSGVGNDRAEISEKTVGVPVIAAGVPTVVDAAALLPAGCGGDAAEKLRGFYVCPKDCDVIAAEMGKLIGRAVNRLCHPSLTFGEMEYI